MAHFHFTSAEPHRRRVIQLGESPDRVFNVGAIGHDVIRGMTLLDRAGLERELGFALGPVNFLVTYHPVTLSRAAPTEALAALFAALNNFPAAHVIFTKPNADTDGRIIGEQIDRYCASRPGRAIAVTSLGQRRYLSAIKLVDAVIGNSSSGLIEVPEFRKPTVNVGPRQRGRLKAASVIDCDESADDIGRAIGKALAPEFKTVLQSFTSPYHGTNVAQQIMTVLKTADLGGVIMKRFFDLDGRA
jgi:UDP-N-acetylglucosamine 2-epimerase (non-hydrolysing)/GDP/UDP-N,N'-diacetylbacillosamine 2-epimerase (hydrolysing)